MMEYEATLGQTEEYGWVCQSPKLGPVQMMARASVWTKGVSAVK
jgi:hypothetical protein